MSSDDLYRTPSANVAGVAGGGGDQLTPGIFDALSKTRFWVMLFGILMFIGAALSALIGLGMIGGGALGPDLSEVGMEGGALVGMGVVYILTSVVYVVLGVFLIQYGSRIGKAVQSHAAADVESALQAQRAFWKTSGILALIAIVVTVLGLVAAVMIPLMAG